MTCPTSERTVRRGIAHGVSIGAAVLLLITGALSILMGISAVADDALFIVGVDYIYELTTTAWGWIHIGIGAALIVTAVGLAAETRWGRGAAMSIAALSIVANFLSVPYAPTWSILIIALDVAAVWAVCTWRGTAA
ncbi:hypothetical protein ACFXHA_10295 [Nocardia sp. NPDC059240]|uniref:DUF7144 family membrane protein n=1 Tax=Nocardia sp. NPDC059240 TaxID=3346786 RepID=UPI00367D6114